MDVNLKKLISFAKKYKKNVILNIVFNVFFISCLHGFGLWLYNSTNQVIGQ